MKHIKIQNKFLSDVFKALDDITVNKYKPKRGKGKLQNALTDKFKQFSKDLEAIRSDHFEKDKSGEGYKKDNNGKVVFLGKYKDDKEVQQKVEAEINTLLDEEAVIDLVEHESQIKSFFKCMEDDDFTPSPDMQDMHFELLVEALEEAFKNTKKEEEEK